MIFTSADIMVRRMLLQRRLPIHYYIEYLTHTTACLRELAFDTLQLVNTAILTPNAAFQANLPCDFLDEVAVSVPVGQFLHPLAHRDDITPLVNYSSTGQPVPYGMPINEVTLPFDFPWTGGFFWSLNDLGENIGREYGLNSTLCDPNVYTIVKSRQQVQFAETFNCGYAIMTYISDGQSITNATQVTPYAINTCEKWSEWKRSPNHTDDWSPEGRSYFNGKRNLRSRLSTLDLNDIRQAIRANYLLTTKT